MTILYYSLSVPPVSVRVCVCDIFISQLYAQYMYYCRLARFIFVELLSKLD